MTDAEPLREFICYAIDQLEQNLTQVLRCARLLTESELWHRPNDHTNSVGNLILHLTGNVSQWILGGIGGQQVPRDRPREFAERGPLPAAEILPLLEHAVRQAVQTLRKLDPGTLKERCEIQGYHVSRLVAIFHVVSHFCFHTGQIIHATKALRNVDLSLYDAQGRPLDARRQFP